MFLLNANKVKLTLRRREPITSGSVNVYPVRFEFSPEWDNLVKTVVFKTGTASRSILLDGSGQCVIPWEVLSAPGTALRVGVYGVRGKDVVLPTVWANLGVILEGAAPGEKARPPTPDLWEQALEGKADGMVLEDLTLRLLSGERTLAQVELPPPGGSESGAIDHRFLAGRDAENQHPAEAVTGLVEALKTIPRPMTADELRKILSGGNSYAHRQHQSIP